MPESKQFTLSVFISHSSKDEKLAAALVDLLRSALNIPVAKIRCTSVTGYGLRIGASIEQQLREEVHQAKAFIALVTPSSIASGYVMFELGARWGAGLHLAPLLGAGADSSYLRGFLGSLNALTCDTDGHVHQLIEDLANELDVQNRTPAAAYQSKLEALVTASKASRSSISVLVPETKPEQDGRAVAKFEVLTELNFSPQPSMQGVYKISARLRNSGNKTAYEVALKVDNPPVNFMYDPGIWDRQPGGGKTMTLFSKSPIHSTWEQPIAFWIFGNGKMSHECLSYPPSDPAVAKIRASYTGEPLEVRFHVSAKDQPPDTIVIQYAKEEIERVIPKTFQSETGSDRRKIEA